MELLKEKILKYGLALNDDVLKVDSFLNHQIDSDLMAKIGQDFANHFKDKKIDKVITIESSGISPALMTSLNLKVPLIIFKKQKSKILKNDIYETKVHSYTQDEDYNLTVSKRFLEPNENVLIIDDFLATGEAVMGASRLLKEAKCNISGVGIVIEKSFQSGRKTLDNEGLEVYSLARISKISENHIEFVE